MAVMAEELPSGDGRLVGSSAKRGLANPQEEYPIAYQANRGLLETQQHNDH